MLQALQFGGGGGGGGGGGRMGVKHSEILSFSLTHSTDM